MTGTYLIIQTVSYRCTQVPQVGLNVSIYNLLIENIDLMERGETAHTHTYARSHASLRYDLAVKYWMIKNKVKTMKMFRRSLKKRTKMRNRTPQAIWRHMATAENKKAERERYLAFVQGRRDYPQCPEPANQSFGSIRMLDLNYMT